MTLEEFIKDDLIRNRWITDGDLDLYLRASWRMGYFEPPEMLRSFEISSVFARNPGQGNFTQFLNALEKRLIGTRFEVIFVENVTSERFQRFFEKRGYTKDRSAFFSAESISGNCYQKQIEEPSQ